jgi:hypothetical protein
MVCWKQTGKNTNFDYSPAVVAKNGYSESGFPWKGGSQEHGRREFGVVQPILLLQA